MKNYDAIIIGFGKAGKTLAGFLGKKGKKVALIEKSNNMYGGTCINVGCIPSKTLAVRSQNVSYDEAMDYKKNLISKLRDKNYHKIADIEGVDVIDGTASFISDHVVSVNGEELSAELVFINTGSYSFMPPIKGADLPSVYTSEGMLSNDELPKRFAVVGGGYIGLEFASMYANYGSEVTVYEMGERLLPREDEDVVANIQSILENRGITFVFNARVSEFKESSDATELLYSVDGQDQSAHFDAILVAAGRRPNTADLKLENTNVELDERGSIKVDEKLETTAQGVYALGDVKGGLQFTYISLDDFRIVKDHLFGSDERSVNNRNNIAYSMFINPTFSRVGMSENEAKSAGFNVKVASMPAAAIPRANVDGKPEGMLKAIVDADTNRILGAVLICEKSEEMINFVQLAMNVDLPYTAVANHIFTHPTMSESLNDLFGLI